MCLCCLAVLQQQHRHCRASAEPLDAWHVLTYNTLQLYVVFQCR